MPPPTIPLRNRDGSPLDVQSMPAVGPKIGAESLPVVLAKGLKPIQSFVPVPVFDPTNTATILATTVQVVPENSSRRYLKIINNGNADVELWTGVRPVKDAVNQSIKQGEIIFAGGGGLVELGERISAIYATATGVTGLMVLEG